jgi:prefoldin subunit 5
MWSALKGALFEEDPNAPKPAPVAAKPAAVVTGAAPTVGQPIVFAPTVNQAFVDAIRKAVFSKQTALTSLVQVADTMAAIIPDQTTRYRAAFAAAGGGRTVQQVAAAADIHLSDIAGEESRFTAAATAKLGGEMRNMQQVEASLGQGIESATRDIAAARKRIEDLETQVRDATNRLAETQAAIASKKAELEQASSEFKAAADAVRTEITTLRQVVVSSLT